jgi:multiple sugar transport system substrate-binding protein
MSEFYLLRRAVLGGLATVGFAAGPARATANSLTIIAHEANKGAATTGAGGDVTAAWRKLHDCDISWVTLDVQATSDRLLREASLGQTSIDLAFQTFTPAQALALMEPLDQFLAADPIADAGADLADFPPALVQALRVDGSLRGIPVRVSTLGLAYNEALFEERGITALPKTFEELTELCRKLTFTRPDGSKVYGLLFTGATLLQDGWTAFARCFGGDYITPDLKIKASEPPVVKSLEALAALYKAGVLPPEMLTMSQEDMITWTQQGRAAITAVTLARLPALNDPKRSKFAGRIKPMDWVMTETLAGKAPFEATVESWSMVMPKNSVPARKQLAWSFIRELSSKQAAVAMALNGNGPARLSAYADPRLAGVPYMPFQARALQHGHITVPAFQNEAKAIDIFVEACQTVMLGRKSAQQAMDDAVARVRPLI